MQAVAVDLPVRDHAHDDLLSAAEDGAEQRLTPLRGHLLGVVQQSERAYLVVAQAAVVQQDPRYDEWPGKRAAPGLVRAGDEPRAEPAVEPQESLAGTERHGR